MSTPAVSQPVVTPPSSTEGPTQGSFKGLLLTSLLMTVVLMIATGIVYPLVMTGVAQVLFRDQANGSLIKNSQGQVVGSSLIGQNFTRPQYFHPRLSAAGKGYDATSSAGTNLGPTNQTLIKNTIAQANLVRQENHLPANYPLPADAVSTSASGLDPNVSPAYAALQVERVAQARGMSIGKVRVLVDKYTSGRTLGVLGESRVNVLELNLALDAVKK